jgi:superfamily II DNA helicase RecQ
MTSLRNDLDAQVIGDLVEATYGVRPCVFQVRSAQEQLRRKDVITIAPTGAGKTLTFWIPLLFNGTGISIIITALNGLGDQNIAELTRLGIPAVNITGQTATDQLFKVRTFVSSLHALRFHWSH